ncbi:metal-dependent phosphohydrolase (plasmid) [Aneurinibacillus sp. Ricciae_BoGa-3]|uniref:metal-dependent phosphohydrolase n=1 Tax=Aneurinibacillus sp. Ricciae_BoGa-3 TaxID=3022697 RepID=UPI00234187EF|nr:metal-dependent phosphohydrolase [Aneurinibacillus sp. Ricciae_BoGa-3]WCK57659.1 metal-dependent phosphohydrolase [Aneurinibacillus sp. Ricciae_BoGa-3]
MENTITKVKVQDLKDGETAIIVGEFAKQVKNASNGDYDFVRISDGTAMATQRVWRNLPISPVIAEIENGDYVQAEVVATRNGEFINVDIKSIGKVERPTETYVDIEGLKQELREVLKEMKDKELHALLISLFNRDDIKEGFFKAPATQMSGYSFEGGLLAKTVRLIRLTKAVAHTLAAWNHNIDNFVSKLNVDFLVTASILVNIGKIHAFKFNGHKIEKTQEGELFEDSYLTMKIVLQELDKSSLPEEQKMMLEHVVGSAKGRQNFGALFIPRSREAVAFHLIESLDVQMSNFEYLDRHAGAEQSFMKLFEKTMFLGIFDEE